MIVFNGKVRVFFSRNYEEFHASKWHKFGKNRENVEKGAILGLKRVVFGVKFRVGLIGVFLENLRSRR